MNWKLSITLMSMSLLAASAAHAAWEVGLYGGQSIPTKQAVTQTWQGQTWTWEGAGFLKSAVVGGHVARWEPMGAMEYGLQLEASHFNVNVKNQSTMRTYKNHGKQMAHQVEDLNPADTDVTTAGLNLLVRYPAKYVQPFVGGGGGVAFADNRPYDYYYEKTAPTEHSDMSVSAYWQVIGGLNVPVTDHLKLSLAYKFMSFPTTFQYVSTVTNDNQVHHLTAGLTYAF